MKKVQRRLRRICRAICELETLPCGERICSRGRVVVFQISPVIGDLAA
jgi:hypothetical protein